MAVPGRVKHICDSDEIAPMVGYPSTSDTKHTSGSKYQHWMSEDDFDKPVEK